jgi:heat shock protein HslJ
MINRIKQSLLILSFLVLVLAACAPGGGLVPAPQQQPGAALEGTSWVLDSFTAGGEEIPVVPGTTVTLVFQENSNAGGNSGCNSYGGEFRVQENRIEFGQIVSTMMACMGTGIMEQEQRFHEALRTAESFELSGDSLVITYADGQLNFSASEG